MKIAAVTRCKDEEDIIEPFIRHTARFVDKIIVLDNGSVDKSLEIISKVRDEGIPVEAFQHIDEVFCEDLHSNWLFHRALNDEADWVFMLDADEFIHVRSGPPDFRDWLSSVPHTFSGIKLFLENYHPCTADNSEQLNPVERIIHRWPETPPIPKVFYRHRGGEIPRVSAGHHFITNQHGVLPCWEQADVVLAHFNARDPWQLARKAVIGWLRMEASGSAAKNTGVAGSYAPMFALLRENPDVFLAQVIDQRNDLVKDPLPYAGEPLRYTTHRDEKQTFIKAVSDFAYRIANRHGRLVDDHPSIITALRAEIMNIRSLP